MLVGDRTLAAQKMPVAYRSHESRAIYPLRGVSRFWVHGFAIGLGNRGGMVLSLPVGTVPRSRPFGAQSRRLGLGCGCRCGRKTRVVYLWPNRFEGLVWTGAVGDTAVLVLFFL